MKIHRTLLVFPLGVILCSSVQAYRVVLVYHDHTRTQFCVCQRPHEMAQPHTKRPNSPHQHCRWPQNDQSPGPPTCQTATKRPSPLPEAYEHAKQCTSTLDGPPAVPKAYEHGKWPRNDAPTPPGPRACQTGHVDPTLTPHGAPLPSGLRAR
jgi:hypothetical protein